MKSKVMIIGDLHISDRFSGKHLNYLENCFECLGLITKAIKEQGITHLICLGDWIGIGLAERNLKNRANLLRLLLVLQEWNTLLNGNLYSLKGNHDIGGTNCTDFDMFVQLGLIKRLHEFDIDACRFHMFDYGEENRKVVIDPERYNIGCFHANLLIEGYTTWYRGGVGVNLSSLQNLYGVELAVAGHIHNPPPDHNKIQKTAIQDKEITLFYPGCVTRPKFEPNIWNVAYGLVVDIDGESIALSIYDFVLRPIAEVFDLTLKDSVDDIDLDDETTAPFDLEALASILNELQYFNLNSGRDYVAQIKRVAGLDNDAADLAVKYLEQAEQEFKE